MSRASLSYILMFIALIAGLWLILRAGSRLAAPADLAGNWSVDWGGADAKLPTQMTFQQSGIFASVTLGAQDLAGRLSNTRTVAGVSGTLVSHDGASHLTLAAFKGGDAFSGSFETAGRSTPFKAFRESKRQSSSATPTTAPAGH